MQSGREPRGSSSSTVRISRARRERSLLMLVSHPRFGEARRDRRKRAAQVVPPRERYAGYIEGEEHRQRQMRTPGGGDRGAKAARDQVATAAPYCADKSHAGGALETGRLQGGCPRDVAQALRLSALLLAEDRRNHSIGRAVADPGRDEKDQKHRQKSRKTFDVHEVHDTNRGGAHGDEVPERHDRAADFVGEPSAKRTRERTHQRS